MTNEEKTIELLAKESVDFVTGKRLLPLNLSDKVDLSASEVSCMIRNACLDMAQWKDDYYKKLLDLLVKSGANADIITNYIENCIEL